MHRSTSRRGFTLIEILIVVIILGILAAIVIPQFSSASNDARKSSLASTAQTMRSQIALYRLQHNDVLPGAGASGFASASFWTQMTTKTDATGAAYSGTSTSGPFGPYMQTTPVNPLAAAQSWQSTVTDGTAATTLSTATGFVYDYTGGTGNFWGTDSTGKTVIP
ncbi:MAG TPA: prepilin-type N-terminal cleavage/methylation domain-containing protein [Humisphaera sp.]|jgi:general secretion pathway protein G|nr:prepilin-type N-terminal cleavage/methylation domain-containing protein [Humisphaera sp.]